MFTVDKVHNYILTCTIMVDLQRHKKKAAARIYFFVCLSHVNVPVQQMQAKKGQTKVC